MKFFEVLREKQNGIETEFLRWAGIQKLVTETGEKRLLLAMQKEQLEQGYW
jgi:hypothetical protein